MTVSAVVFVTVKVTMPLELEGPLAAEMMERPAPWLSVTVLPLTGFPVAFFRVTAMLEVAVPSATTAEGLAVTVDWLELAELKLLAAVVSMAPLERMLSANRSP